MLKYFWDGFEKQAYSTSQIIGKFSKGGKMKPLKLPKMPSIEKKSSLMRPPELNVSKTVGRFSRGGQATPPMIPGAHPHAGSPAAIPGQGAIVQGVHGAFKKAPTSVGSGAV